MWLFWWGCFGGVYTRVFNGLLSGGGGGGGDVMVCVLYDGAGGCDYFGVFLMLLVVVDVWWCVVVCGLCGCFWWRFAVLCHVSSCIVYCLSLQPRLGKNAQGIVNPIIPKLRAQNTCIGFNGPERLVEEAAEEVKTVNGIFPLLFAFSHTDVARIAHTYTH